MTTDVRSRKIALYYRALLNKGELPKNAMTATRNAYRTRRGLRISRRSVYRYCRRHRISTK